MIIHPTEGSEPRIRHRPRWADLFSKSCFQSAESTGKYQYRLVSRSIMINCCRNIAWHAFFFFFFLRTIDATTNGCDFQNCIQSNRIPMSLHLSTLHRSTCSTRGGARVAVLWQSRLPRGFLRCVLRVRHQMIPSLFSLTPIPPTCYSITELKSVHSQLSNTLSQVDRLLNKYIKDPHSSGFVSKVQKAKILGGHARLFDHRIRNRREEKRYVIEFSTTSERGSEMQDCRRR